MTRPWTIVSILCLFTITALINNIHATESALYKEVLNDLPQKSDLEIYLSALERIVNFVHNHYSYLDIHIGFGLFLVNVNLKHTVQKAFKRLPDDIKLRFKHIFLSTDDLLDYYHNKVESKLENSEETPELYISSLFKTNEQTWSNHLVKFKPTLLLRTRPKTDEELEKTYSAWPEYVDKVFDFEHGDPNPEQAVKCLAQLGKVRISPLLTNFDHYGSHCLHEPNHCSGMILNGTSYGYSLVHRVLYGLMGRFSRGCTIVSESVDKKATEALCSKIYNEADYIARHESRMPYLSMGQIAICSLEGHVQFMRRSWINPLLKYQTDFGCFGRGDNVPDNIQTNQKPVWQVHIRGPILGGLCNTPTTGVAASMLAAAIRLIIEQFYR